MKSPQSEPTMIPMLTLSLVCTEVAPLIFVEWLIEGALVPPVNVAVAALCSSNDPVGVVSCFAKVKIGVTVCPLGIGIVVEVVIHVLSSVSELVSAVEDEEKDEGEGTLSATRLSVAEGLDEPALVSTGDASAEAVMEAWILSVLDVPVKSVASLCQLEEELVGDPDASDCAFQASETGACVCEEDQDQVLVSSVCQGA